MDSEFHDVVVLGLGNLMRTDDSAGMQALTRLARDPRLPAAVRLVEGGSLGLELLYHLEGASHLLVLDAVDAEETPGTLMLFRDEAVETLPCGRSIHLLGLADLLSAMRLSGRAPSEVVLLGIQPASTEWGTQLTPVVDAALGKMTDAALSQIAAWKT